MLGLTCLQDYWPVSGWILKLFVAILERLHLPLRTPPSLSHLKTARGIAGSRHIVEAASHSLLNIQSATSDGDGTTMNHAASLLTAPAGSQGDLPADQLNHDNLLNLDLIEDLLYDYDQGQVDFFGQTGFWL